MTFCPDVALVQLLNDQVQSWRQGDLIDLAELRDFQWMAMPEKALTARAAEADGNGLVYVSETAALAIVSQTCDIVRPCQQRPYLLLAPVVLLDEPVAGEARKGRRSRFASLPGAGEYAFVDLERVMTVEKSILLTSARVRGLTGETSQRKFGAAIARKFSRFAFPDDLTTSLRRLMKHISNKHGRDSPEGRALGALQEIRVTGTPSWDVQEIDVFIDFCPATLQEATGIMNEADWEELVNRWMDRAEPSGVIRSVAGAMLPLEDMTALEYLASNPLDLDYLSWSPDG